MILQALSGYYDRMLDEGISDLEPKGYKRIAIPFLIVIDSEGQFIGIDDTRIGEGKKKQAGYFFVPKIFEGSRTSNVKANLLWDKASYVFGLSPKAKPERLTEQRRAFRDTIMAYFPNAPSVKPVEAVIKFLDNHITDVQNHQNWAEISSTDPNLAFRLEGHTELICNSREVNIAISGITESQKQDIGICLITGSLGPLARLENPIKGLRGSGKAESHWVAFNESAYWSYNKERGANAPISKSASTGYINAFNYLQRKDSRQCLTIGDSTIVFWAEKKHVIESVFADIFGEPAKGEPEQDYKRLIALFRSPETGAAGVELDPNTKFFVLGLVPNAARIAVRFWYAGTVGDIAKNIGQHFDDLEMAKGSKEWRKITLKSLLRSTAFDEKDDRIAPNLAGDTMKSILTGTPYPRTLLASVISRIKAEQSRKDSKGKSVQNVNYTRAALIKAVLARETRYYKQDEKEIGMSLDTTNTNPGYLLGRLFAVLEKVQAESAGGWGNINTTIRDRFYGAASSTPVTAFPYLMKLKNHHLSKLEKHKGYYEGLIGEIMDKLDVKEGFPTHLSLQDQGRFAIGYYHQRYAK